MPAIDAKAINIYMSVTGPYASQMTRQTAVTNTFGNTAQASMGKAQTSMARFGAVASKVATVGAIAVAVGLALSAKAAITFESSFAGVRKTIETTEVGFQRLSDGIRRLATEIPIGVNELNKIGELGGQLGVGADDLLEFIKTIAMVGVTTTLSTEEAALGFARLDNIMQLGGKSFDRIGATIVDLGNNFAATEDEILNFALRIAPVGATVGLTTGEILAIATAFTSVGIKAESGGTAVQKTFIKMADAADRGGMKLQVFADTAGMTSEAFADLFEQDPAAAFSAFVMGLADVKEAGGSVFVVLDAVSLGNERVRKALLAAANAGDVLTDTLDRQEGSWEDNIALTEEAGKRFDTTASKLILAKNKVIDLGIAIGTGLLPLIGDMALGFSTVIGFLGELNNTAVIATAGIIGLTGAAKLAFAHPIIAGLFLLAGAFALIGRNAEATDRRIKIMKDTLGITATGRSEFGDPVDVQGLEDLQGLIGEESLEGLLRIGLKPVDVKNAIFGSEADYQKFVQAVRSVYFGLSAEVGAIGKEEQFILEVEAGKEPFLKGFEEVGKRRAERKQIEIEEAEFQLKLTSLRRRQSQAEELDEKLRLMRGKSISESIAGFKGATIESKFVDDVADALGDYVDTVQEAFEEVEDSIFDNLDAWYEFDDELEVVWDDIIETLNKQVNAMGDINELIAEAALAPAVEKLFRSVVADPGVALQFLELTLEEQADFFEHLVGVVRNAKEKVREEWEREYGRVEFVAGQQFLDDIAAIAAEIEADEKNIFNAAEIWLGLIENTLDAEGPEVRQKIIDALIGAFGADSPLFDDIAITQEQIDFLLLTLMELAGEYEVRIKTTFEHTPGSDIFDFTPDPPSTFMGKPQKHGGFVFPDRSYLTSELGPELFRPFNAGTIIPNDKLFGGKEVTYNLNVYGSEDTGSDARTVLLTAQTIGAF